MKLVGATGALMNLEEGPHQKSSVEARLGYDVSNSRTLHEAEEKVEGFDESSRRPHETPVAPFHALALVQAA